MNPGPLQLFSCFFTTVNIAVQHGANAEHVHNFELEVNPEASPPSEGSDAPRTWFVFLNIKIKPKEGLKSCYLGELQIVGSFNVSPEWPDDQIEKLVYINGSGMLYSAAREMVSIITGRGFFGSLFLPSVSFAAMHKELAEKRKSESNTPQTTPPNPA
jgi:preprotein translocase subunit SecB